MLHLLGEPRQNCDKLTRRSFLLAGAIGIGGLKLSDLLRAEALAGISSSNKSIINIHLDGGPPQMDMIDMKPQAPLEIRGEFRSMPTAIPGFHINELMPKIARSARNFSFLRSLVGADSRHDAFQCQSGFSAKELQNIGGRPAMGCVLNQRFSGDADVPTFVDMMQGRPLVRNSARPGFLGPAYQPFRPDISQMFSRPLEEAMKGELAALGKNHTTELTLHASLNAKRLQARDVLLNQLDRIRREIDDQGMMDAVDQFHQQAAGILTSGTLANALDLSREDPSVMEKYTASPTGIQRFSTSDDEQATLKLLLARRLIDAGVRCVSVSFSDFDTHSSNFKRLRHILPILDHGLNALITDLSERGKLDDVLIIVWGEFGRTPKINTQAGRDHWPRVSMGMMAGGGLQHGQVIGATDRWAAEVTSRAVHYQDVLATLYHHLGIDALATTITDPSGRPQYLLDHGQPIRELI
ncbi:MAG: DUF1501 domain-containing protein [Planctomycetaceae bacterium]|nr:DUF1501 domain-containing protein [Planctomycetaceae bacterium]